MPRSVQDRVKERFAAAAGVQLPTGRCVWSVNRAGKVVCAVKGRLTQACVDALRLRREHPGKRAYVRLHQQAEEDRRAHKCEAAPVLEAPRRERIPSHYVGRCPGCDRLVNLLNVRPWADFGIEIGECPECGSTLEARKAPE